MLKKLNLVCLSLMLASALVLNGCGGSDGADGEVDGSSTSVITDTDGDGLSDADEINIFHTSEILVDTDGDQISDFDEVTVGGAKKALIANVPKLDISIVGSITIDLEGALTSGCTDAVSSTTLEAKSSSFGRSNSKATSTTIENSESLSVSASANFPGGVSAETTGELSSSEESTSSNSSGWTSDSAKASQEEFQNSKECLDESVTEAGSVTVGFQIDNTGATAVNLTALSITLLQIDPQNPKSFITLGTAVLAEDNDGTQWTINSGGNAGPLAATVVVGAQKAMKLWANPAGLMFKVAYKTLTDQNSVNYAWIGDDVVNRTGSIVIDYGVSKQDSKGLNIVDSYRVAANVLRNPDLSAKGITLGEVFTDILEIPYTTVTVDINATHKRIVFESINGVMIDQVSTRLWFLSSNSETIVGHPDYASMEDIIIKPGTVVNLTLIQDQDHDGLFDREEYVYGTDRYKADTDGDGLSDYTEVKTGWLNGFSGDYIYSSALIADMDGDTLNDAQEYNLSTDPRNTDTDKDGIVDQADDANSSAAITPAVEPLKWTMAAMGSAQSAGIKSDGSLWVWGRNHYGVLGLDANDTDDKHTPVQMPLDGDGDGVADTDWKQVDIGFKFMMAIKEDGTLWGWGSNDFGKIGIGSTAYTVSPQEIVIGTERFSKVATKNNSAYVLTQTGKIYATGYNAYGQLGLGDTTNRNAFVQVGTASDWADIAAESSHFIAVKDASGNNDVWGCGDNANGQIGDSTTSNYTVLTPMVTNAGNGVIAGTGSSFAIDATNTLRVRGRNDYGQIGLQTGGQNLYDWVAQDEKFKKVCSSYNKSLGITASGQLKSWGKTDYGQRGVGTTPPAAGDSYIMTLVGDASNWIGVACGQDQGMAWNTNGDLYAWGRGSYGELGNGSTDIKYVPVKVDNPLP